VPVHADIRHFAAGNAGLSCDNGAMLNRLTETQVDCFRVPLLLTSAI
jgi:hypothetical protein